jgi:prevent-host-death family protein
MRRHFGAIVQQLCKSREHAIIQSNGAPIAVVLPVAEYERLMAQERLAAFSKFARSFGLEVEKRGLSEEELLADLEETKREVFEERYGKLG